MLLVFLNGFTFYFPVKIETFPLRQGKENYEMFFAPRFDENQGRKIYKWDGHGHGHVEVGLVDTWAKSWSLLFVCLFFSFGGKLGAFITKSNGALCSRVDVSFMWVSVGEMLIRKALRMDVFHSVTRLAIPKVPHQTNNDSAAFGIFLITLQPHPPRDHNEHPAGGHP